ncbi:MAG: hypothetical protein ACD_75C00480G0001, partial [uncultured bacterium]
MAGRGFGDLGGGIGVADHLLGDRGKFCRSGGERFRRLDDIFQHLFGLGHHHPQRIGQPADGIVRLRFKTDGIVAFAHFDAFFRQFLERAVDGPDQQQGNQHRTGKDKESDQEIAAQHDHVEAADDIRPGYADIDVNTPGLKIFAIGNTLLAFEVV